MGKHERIPSLETRRDGLAVERRLNRVRHKNHDHVGPGSRLSDPHDGQSSFLCRRPGAAPLAQADPDFTTAVLQVKRVGVPLAAVTDDGDLFVCQQVQVGVSLVIQVSHDNSPPKGLMMKKLGT